MTCPLKDQYEMVIYELTIQQTAIAFHAKQWKKRAVDMVVMNTLWSTQFKTSRLTWIRQ